MNWLAITIFVIIIISGAIGYCRGFLKTVLSLVAALLSIVITAVMTPVIGDFVVKNDTIYSGVYEVVEDNITDNDKYTELVEKQKEIEEDMRKGAQNIDVREIVENVNIPNINKEALVNEIEDKLDGEIGVQEATECICDYMTRMIINTVVYVITLIVVSVVIFLLMRVIVTVGSLPLIREFDKIAGMAAGLALGALVVLIFMVVVTMCSGNKAGEYLLECISENDILSWTYDNNPIMMWISKYLNK